MVWLNATYKNRSITHLCINTIKFMNVIFTSDSFKYCVFNVNFTHKGLVFNSFIYLLYKIVFILYAK